MIVRKRHISTPIETVQRRVEALRDEQNQSTREIFVFGSNLAGRHGRGAALYARRHHGAIYGQGEGLQGDSYAIPTKDEQLRARRIEDVQASVERFLDFAYQHPELIFRVSKVGCGLAGFRESTIKTLFQGAPGNCILPAGWRE